jgi:hypothetical protein
MHVSATLISQQYQPHPFQEYAPSCSYEKKVLLPPCPSERSHSQWTGNNRYECSYCMKYQRLKTGHELIKSCTYFKGTVA